MNALETKIPPPAVAVATAVAMWQLSPESSGIVWWAAAGILFFLALGTFFLASAIRSFKRVKTSSSPMDPGIATVLVTDGIFQYSRHPMYVGVTCLLTAWAVYLNCGTCCNLRSVGIVCGPPFFALYMLRFQIPPEERALRTKFGEQYRNYERKVNLWM